MKSLMHTKLLISLLLFVLVASWHTAVSAHENNLVGADRDVEVVYMYSYACPTCRRISPYMNAFDRAFPEIVKLPVYSEKSPNDLWQTAARRAFLLKILQKEGLLNVSSGELERLGFAIQDEDVSQVHDNKASFLAFLQAFGVNLSEKQLNGPWDLSVLYMQDTAVMLSRVREELGRVATPIIRVSSDAGVDYIAISPESDDPPMDFLIRASESIKRHKKAALRAIQQPVAAKD